MIFLVSRVIKAPCLLRCSGKSPKLRHIPLPHLQMLAAVNYVVKQVCLVRDVVSYNVAVNENTGEYRRISIKSVEYVNSLYLYCLFVAVIIYSIKAGISGEIWKYFSTEVSLYGAQKSVKVSGRWPMFSLHAGDFCFLFYFLSCVLWFSLISDLMGRYMHSKKSVIPSCCYQFCQCVVPLSCIVETKIINGYFMYM